MKRICNIKVWGLIFIEVILMACVNDQNFEMPMNNCNSERIANASYSEIKNLYVDETIKIQDDLIIEGYVISSDEEGNFFSVLHFQDRPENPTDGFQISIDQRDSYLYYPIGSKIFIKLKGLYLGKSKEVYKIGGAFTSFGNISVGRLPATVVGQHIFRSCNEKVKIQPSQIAIDQLSTNLTNTLVQFARLEFIQEDQEKTFAVTAEETERVLTDCLGNKILLLNSGYSNFKNDTLPSGNGTITGVLRREKNDFHLVIRNTDDIDFNQEPCIETAVLASSNTIFFSELADPDNNASARFIELYNSASKAISLQGWQIHRYTNKNTTVSSEIDLSGYSITSNATFVIAANKDEFQMVYGSTPNLVAGINSPADSNGDDNFQLINPFGEVIDTFGVIGEDGTNTNHEFEDGGAFRKPEIKNSNAIYTFSEWQIFNDTGAEGTTNTPLVAPDDFSPGVHGN